MPSRALDALHLSSMMVASCTAAAEDIFRKARLRQPLNNTCAYPPANCNATLGL